MGEAAVQHFSILEKGLQVKYSSKIEIKCTLFCHTFEEILMQYSNSSSKLDST